jgi:hypothetical protein
MPVHFIINAAPVYLWLNVGKNRQIKPAIKIGSACKTGGSVPFIFF